MTHAKVVVTVPTDSAAEVRRAIGEAGGGTIGNYMFCSFSAKGIGRFTPNEDAQPAIGSAGDYESVEEERIEVTCTLDTVVMVVNAIKSVHPYEEPAIDVYPLLEIN